MINPKNKISITNITYRTRANKARPTEQNKDAAGAHEPELNNVEDEDVELEDGTIELEQINLRKKGHKK